jgi:hypothetical protein
MDEISKRSIMVRPKKTDEKISSRNSPARAPRSTWWMPSKQVQMAILGNEQFRVSHAFAGHSGHHGLVACSLGDTWKSVVSTSPRRGQAETGFA